MILHSHSNVEYTIYFDKVDSISTIDAVATYENFDAIQYKYAYSFDNSTWSEFFDNSAELVSHLAVNQTIYINIYLKCNVSIEKTKTLSYAFYKIEKILINNTEAKVVNMHRSNSNNILTRTNTKNLYRPYRDTDKAVQLNKSLARGISDIFAFETVYFRTEADEESRLATFKTYPLINVKEYKSLPVVIKNNQLPDSRFQYNEFDYDFQDELEIHIVIEVWREIFGDIEPNANDYLYLGLTNRMYQINTVYEVKQFMNVATYYTAMLVKYQNRADVVESEDTDNLVSTYVDYVDDFDKIKIAEEAIDARRDDLHEPNDIDETAQIINSKLVYNGLSVLDYMYDFTDKSNDNIAISYNELQQSEDEFSIACWFKLPALSKRFSDIATSPKRILNLITSKNFENENLFRIYATNLSTISTELIVSADYKVYVNCVCHNALKANTVYGLLVNYAYNQVGKFMTISIIDENFNIVGEVIDTTLHSLSKRINTLNVHSGISIGNIRFKKTHTNKNDILTELSNKTPQPSKYYVADNAVAPMTTTSPANCLNEMQSVSDNDSSISKEEDIRRILAIVQDPNYVVENVSTFERDALSLENESIVYNTDTSKYEQFIGDSWRTLQITEADGNFNAW